MPTRRRLPQRPLRDSRAGGCLHSTSGVSGDGNKRSTAPQSDVAKFLSLADPQGSILGLTLLEQPPELLAEVAAFAALQGLVAIPDPKTFHFQSRAGQIITCFWFLGAPTSSWLRTQAHALIQTQIE